MPILQALLKKVPQKAVFSYLSSSLIESGFDCCCSLFHNAPCRGNYQKVTNMSLPPECFSAPALTP
jgi:hypothetical protein